RNQGEGAARNTAIGAASQPWIGVLDSDDAWHPDLLATLWPLRAGHVLVAGAALYRRAGGEIERYAGLPWGARRRLASPRALIAGGNPIPASGVLARRDVVLACGGFDASLRFCADLDLWLRMLEHGTGVLSARPVVDYHLHAGQVTRDRAAAAAGHRRVLEGYADRPWFARPLLEAWRGGVAWDDLREALGEGRGGGMVATARFLAGHPARPAGLARLLITRALMRRRLSALDPGS
ncbi:MAG: glycosyltransferase, partial [Solirubrobacterales bacterium]|nr:glycosyltransferase [Solirubrobacterales bacterium]